MHQVSATSEADAADAARCSDEDAHGSRNPITDDGSLNAEPARGLNGQQGTAEVPRLTCPNSLHLSTLISRRVDQISLRLGFIYGRNLHFEQNENETEKQFCCLQLHAIDNRFADILFHFILFSLGLGL